MFLHGLVVFRFLLSIFTVSQRHNTTEHGGRMSRSKRNAALQACILFCNLTPKKEKNKPYTVYLRPLVVAFGVSYFWAFLILHLI